MSDSRRLAWKMKQSRLIHELYMDEKLSVGEIMKWEDELKQPNTLWGWISWRFFGL